MMRGGGGVGGGQVWRANAGWRGGVSWSPSQTAPFGKRGEEETLFTLQQSTAQQVVPTGVARHCGRLFREPGCRHRFVHRTHPCEILMKPK